MHILYIIGNGFDLHHGIPSSYGSFKCFLNRIGRQYDISLLDLLFGENNLWSNFENALGMLSSTQFESFIQWYSNHERDRNVPTHIAVGNGSDDIYSRIETDFNEWIKSLDIDTIKPKLCLEEGAFYLTFNYTQTLEGVYGVSSDNVLHIHNQVSDNRFIYGHGLNDAAIAERATSFEDDSIRDEYVKLMRGFQKKTSDLIHEKIAAFIHQIEISKVIVIGHSLNEIDMPYFEYIQRCTSPSIPWEISVYNDTCITKLKKNWKLHKHGIRNVSFFEINKYNK